MSSVGTDSKIHFPAPTYSRGLTEIVWQCSMSASFFDRNLFFQRLFILKALSRRLCDLGSIWSNKKHVIHSASKKDPRFQCQKRHLVDAWKVKCNVSDDHFSQSHLRGSNYVIPNSFLSVLVKDIWSIAGSKNPISFANLVFFPLWFLTIWSPQSSSILAWPYFESYSAYIMIKQPQLWFILAWQL